MVVSMKFKKSPAVIGLTLCFALLSACALTEDMWRNIETSVNPNVSAEPIQVQPGDVRFPEERYAYITRSGEWLYARNPLPTPTPEPLFTPEPSPTLEPDPLEDPEDEVEPAEPEPTEEPIVFREFEELEPLEPLEIVRLLGMTADGAYYIAVTQRGLGGYVFTAYVSDYNEEAQYKLAYRPDRGVSQPTLALLESVVPGVLTEPLLAQTDSYLAKLENPGQTGQAAYLPHEWLLLDVRTARKLAAARDALAEQNLRLKAVGGYYPQTIQYRLFRAVGDERFVPDPKDVSRNAQGLAVDVVLVDSAGRELEFPTSVYTYTNAAVYPYAAAGSAQRQNAQLLREVMENAGFTAAPENWWQFYDAGADYMISNIPYENMILTAAYRDWD
jgi:D-alanyl-D-alanine dipeptidase